MDFVKFVLVDLATDWKSWFFIGLIACSYMAGMMTLKGGEKR